MSEPNPLPFLTLLEKGIEKGGFETDDVLAILLPLMKQVLATHAAGLVAPLRGLLDLGLTENDHLMFPAEKAAAPAKNLGRIEKLQTPASHAVDVVAESQRTADLNHGTLTTSDLGVSPDSSGISKPLYLPNYQCWEHAVGHHDELTDIFSLGMLLASLSCGLDFTDAGQLELFSLNRANLFRISARLNPVLASAIVQMTELNRHRRSPDLAQMILRLEQYRDQPADLNFDHLHGFKESGPQGKRRLIQSRLRDRLFEISRRNRLIYFKPNLQTLNLTIASVPVLMDFKNIRREQLFVWHPELAATVTEGTPMSLGKYLRFEDAPYITGVLDKIISEARHDRNEFGFSQLRLVLCFLRWNNLKESPEERIHSPLLLLPVELTKKKGVRDNYVLEPTTSEAEVNPALRHHLKELYNLNLPEFVELKETSLDQLYEAIKLQIHASEPGVTLNKIDRPQIELIHEKAVQRVDQYRRRIKAHSPRARNIPRPEYSYDRENFRPMGLQLFIQKIRPTLMPLRDAVGAPSQGRLPHIVEAANPAETGKVLETERQMFALREGDNQNPYSWDFDLCNLTLGNFNYRKMTLVSDYAGLIETDLASTAFDAVFSLTSKAAAEAPPLPLDLADQHHVIACDATQAAAISRARTGASYIIQGPPGTGKSQTITNLIADYVAQGKRVLFVCEKRAAIDVVFHRLRQQGLDELCCLIHDSQTDKKAFIQNLKQTYEKFLGQSDPDPNAKRDRSATLRAMEQDLASLGHYSGAMSQTHARAGTEVRSLLHRLVELRNCYRKELPETEDLLPEYPLWLQHGDVIARLQSALAELSDETCFAKHPVRWIGKTILQSPRPLETLTRHLDEAEDLLDGIQTALELSGLPADLWDTFEEIQTILEFASRAHPLAERNLLGILSESQEAQKFDALCNELNSKRDSLAQAQEKAIGWHDPLSPEDTQTALVQARTFEKSILRFLQPAFWRLKNTLQARYDFSRHAVAPSWHKLLEDLAALHTAQAGLTETGKNARLAWHSDDPDTFRALVAGLRNDRLTSHVSVKALLKQLAQSSEASALILNLKSVHDRFAQLDLTLGLLLAEHVQFAFPELAQVLSALREQSGLLSELSPVLGELAEMPEALSYALRWAQIPLSDFEASMGQKSLDSVYREDRAIDRFNGRILSRKMESLEKHHREWLNLNARCIRAGVRKKFLQHVNISSLPASQLDPDQKTFKKTYAAGRRELEHEFGKSMRYKSIRDLAAGDTGQVIQDLKPIWLMSPLSVSDTLPLDPTLFDVVIFDEASQIPVEEAIPAIYRSHQAIVVGDEMQLPPSSFFAGARNDDESVVVEEEGQRVEVDLDSDSFLTQSATNLPSTLLAWHYRSRYESLISFSNAAFYGGNLFTIPDRQRALAKQSELIVTSTDQGAANVDELLARSISFHFMEKGCYEDRRNPNEAAYIAQLVRGLLLRGTKLSIGVVAFSEAQQTEIESALRQLADEDSTFETLIEAEYVREENDVFCGLFVKNLENVQGDERDIIIMSVCYGHDANGRMLMNFGPINQRGGEKRLNVIFSRAKLHMAIVSSIRPSNITNDYNDGANSLKNFLRYAEAVSKGDTVQARQVLENLNPLNRKTLDSSSQSDAVVKGLAARLRELGYWVDLSVGQSKFRCDLAVRREVDGLHELGILVDTENHYANPNLLDRFLMQPSNLRAFGWQILMVLTKDWYHNPEDVVNRIEKLLQGLEGPVEPDVDDLTEATNSVPKPDEPSRPPTPLALPSELPVRESKPNSGALKNTVRHFELVSGSSRKFWDISLSENSFTVRFGRIGTPGQSQTKTFPNENKASQEATALIAEKIKKGYQEK